MSANDSLTDLERRAWRATFDDGLLDLTLGATLLIMGVSRMVPNDRWLYPLFFGVVAVSWILKRYVVLPRTGIVRFAEPRRQRTVASTLVLGASALLGVAVTTVFALGGSGAEWLRTHPIVFELGFPVMVLAVFAALASFLDVRRVYFIGIVFAASFGVHMQLNDTRAFLVGGAAVALPGIVLFARFLRSHPKLDERSAAGGRHG